MIKKHKNKNNYYYAKNGLWVRDFSKKSVVPIDINNLMDDSNIKLILDNELSNKMQKIDHIDAENFTHRNIIIISNGFNIQKKQELIDTLPNDVIIMGVNGIFNEWKSRRRIHYYIINNPYKDCLTWLPKQKIGTRCIASTRTYPEFLKKWNGMIYQYLPTISEKYSGYPTESSISIDDYRNPICAAINLAFRFGVKKLLLFCCDDSFKEEKISAEKLANGLWMYPQHRTAYNLIDGCLYWLSKNNIKVGDHSSGLNYTNASYINANELTKFFKDEGDE